MKLTEHFTLEELTRSDTALRLGIDNTPPRDLLDNLAWLAVGLERVRALLGVPLIVTSGYRCPALNVAIGGSAKSAHLNGLAADFKAPAFGDPLRVCKVIAASPIQFEQLIQEGSWTHIAFPPINSEARRDVLTAHFANGRATYTEGLA